MVRIQPIFRGPHDCVQLTTILRFPMQLRDSRGNLCKAVAGQFTWGRSSVAGFKNKKPQGTAEVTSVEGICDFDSYRTFMMLQVVKHV